MRQVLLGLLGVMAAGAAHAESYSFAAMIQRAFQEQTTIQCEGAKLSGRVPTGCILSERAIAYPNADNRTAYPNLTNPKGLHSSGVACAAGHPIVFHPNGTLAECVLDAQQPETVSDVTFKVPLGDCKGRVRFNDKDGRVEC